MITRTPKAISIPAAKPQSLALARVCRLGRRDSSWLKYMPSAHVRTQSRNMVIRLDLQPADHTITVISEKAISKLEPQTHDRAYGESSTARPVHVTSVTFGRG